jgi:GNAT superfamily N-acetyltransferase
MANNGGSVNHPTRMSDKKNTKSYDLFQTTDRSFSDQGKPDEPDEKQYPMGMPHGDNSDINVNDVVQPSITVQAAIRRLKLTAQPIKKGSNFPESKYKRAVFHLELALRKSQPRDLGEKDGLSLRYVKDQFGDHLIYLRDDHLKIVGLLMATKGRAVSNVFVLPKYRGQGLGTVLYLGAIHVLGKLKSSYDIGTMAVRTWKSVSKYHRVTLVDAEDHSVDFEWGPGGIPSVGGTPIDRMNEIFYFQAVK